MILIDRSRAATPASIIVDGPLHLKSDIEPIVRDTTAQLKTNDFKRSIYVDDIVKRRLWHMQHMKCCFCEQRRERDFSTVEHFRPKTSVRRADGIRQRPGYWWLAYEFQNLFFCCQNCNNPKNDHFPLQPGSVTLKEGEKPWGGGASEQPLIINPATVDPERHIEWQWNAGVGYVPVGVTEMGKCTIRLCKLATRDDLRRIRYDYYKESETPKWIRVWKLAKKLGNAELVKVAIDALHRLVRPSAPFAGMMRSVLKRRGVL